MQKIKIIEIKDLPKEKQHPLIELDEAISNLQLLLYPNAKSQQITSQNQILNPQQELKFEEQVPLNKNQDEEPFNIFSRFSNQNSDPSSLLTHISTLTQYQNNVNELFPKLLNAQKLINLEWRKLENLSKFQSIDNLPNNQLSDSSCKDKNQNCLIQENLMKTYELLQNLLCKAKEDQQNFKSSKSTSSGEDFQTIEKNDLDENYQVSISLSNLQEIESNYFRLLKQLELNKSDKEIVQYESEEMDQIEKYDLNKKRKYQIKKQFSDLIQNIQNSNYLDDEIVTQNGQIQVSETHRQDKKKSRKHYDFTPTPLSLEENPQDTLQEYLLRISILQKSSFDEVFSLFEKMDGIQRILLRITTYRKNKNNIKVQQEIQNCILQMKKNYTTDLKLAVLCLRFSKLYIQSIITLNKRIEQLDGEEKRD